MARKVLLEGTGYSLTPSTRTFTIPKYLPQERVILITNLSSNKVVYNFSDPSLGYTSWTAAIDPVTLNETTTIVLKYDTTAMFASDEFQILIDEDSQLITPSGTYMDPTNKMRVTQPQALIDTDFEYGVQNSKWETESLIDNRPFFYQSPTQIPNITAITQPVGQRTVTVTTSVAHGLIVGQAIVVIDAFFGPSNGNFIVETVTSTTFTYTSKISNTLSYTNLFDSNKTAIYQGNVFTDSAIGGPIQAFTYNASTGAAAITTTVPHGLSLGNEIAVVGIGGTFTNTNPNGNFVVATINSATQFTYYCGTGTITSPTGTTVSPTVVTTATTNAFPSGSTVTNQITLSGYTTGALANIQIGSPVTGPGIQTGTVVTAISGSTITLSKVTNAAIVTAIVNFYATIYVRPQGQVAHRPFDGGVIFSTNSMSNNTSTIRQTRRYFRYQSGKGIQISSGTILKPYSNVDQITVSSLTGYTGTITGITASSNTVTYATTNTTGIVAGQYITIAGAGTSGFNGTFIVNTVTAGTNFTVLSSVTGASSAATYQVYPTVTVQTKEKHNIVPGVTVSISGSTDPAYNITNATVVGVSAWNRFQYIANGLPTNYAAPGNLAVAVTGWSGATTRLGLFDSQNGIFFEYDGSTLYAVRRSSTYQIAGKVSVAYNSSLITQTDPSFSTLFSKQVTPGDAVVLRGMIYRVTDVLSDTQMLISPGYRGLDSQYVVISKVVDTKIPQSQFNIDRMDGTGPSGYNTDLTKMQMFYMDYTWYGAGFVRWGLRGVKGDVTYIHKLPNNNVNTEAYMRSGNLPGRYEINHTPPITTLSANIDNATSVIPVADPSKFPSSGTVGIRQSSITNYGGNVTQAVTAVTGNGTTAVYTTANTTGLMVGAYVNVTGLSNAGFNITNQQITAVVANTSFSVLNATNATITGQTGTVYLVSNISAMSASGSLVTVTNASGAAGIVAGQYVTISNASNSIFNGTYLVNTVPNGTTFTFVSGIGSGTTATTATYSSIGINTTIEYVNYTGKSTNSLTGATRGRAGTTGVSVGAGVTLTIAANSSIGTVTDASTLQAGMRVIGAGNYLAANSNYLAIPENTFIVSINGTQITLSQAVTVANPSVYFLPMGGTATSFTYSATAPIAVELAYPTFSPIISHWGTSVIMDGRYDDDRSLLFTYGQQQQTTLGNASGYYPVSSVTGTGTVAVYSTANTQGLVVGQPISVSGFATAGWNVTGATITNVIPNVSFTVTNATAAATQTATAIATFGAPIAQAIAGLGGNTSITVPAITNLTLGQTLTGDGTRLPTSSQYIVNSISTSQVGNITGITSTANTGTISSSSYANGLTTFTTNSTSGMYIGQPITLSGMNGSFLTTNITAYTGTTTGATYTIANTAGLYVGQQVTISGLTGTSNAMFNGTFTITSITANTSFTTNNTVVQAIQSGQTGLISLGGGATAYNGVWLVNTIPNSTTFTVVTPNFGVATIGAWTQYTATYTVGAGDQTSVGTTTAGVTVTAYVGSGTVATYTTTNTAGMVVGQPVTISALSGANSTFFNGTFYISAIVANASFSVAHTTTQISVTGQSGTAVAGTAFNKYVNVSSAVTPGYNGAFLSVNTTSTTFTVVTPTAVNGLTSTAQAIVYSAGLSQALGGTGYFYENALLYGANSKALFSIRISPSVDNGTPTSLGARELTNRMQLILRSLDLSTAVSSTVTQPINILVTAILNGVPTTTTAWTNVVKNQIGVANSSLAMIADYAGFNTNVTGGEVTGGFFTSSTTSLDLGNVRDLGNSILGGGGTTSNTNIYPDGPDTLTIVATNLSSVPVPVSGRLSWTEAQA
jgi:hypothetical protein